MRTCFLLALIFLLPVVVADEFPQQFQNSGFIGWDISEDEKIGEFRISYPSVFDGEGANMAQNGPFAVVIFFTDEGEDVDQYVWLQDGLAQWAYISLVISDEVDWESIEYMLTGWNNGSSEVVPDAQGMFALNHISLSGHGVGAHTAAEIVKSGEHQINGLFGLGLDGASTQHTSDVILSRPSIALFLTGTTDNIAPASENVKNYLSDWPGAWQIMYPRGANHIGYQESDTFFERFADGDSTMGRDGQQQHALDHILSYLNLSLKGVDDAYAAAFNREDKSVSSDSEAYIDENLERSRLYKMDNISSDKPSVMLNQSFTLSAEVTMRDGTQAFGNVSCLLPDGRLVMGQLIGNIASCTINGSFLSPGFSMVEIHIADYSFSDWLGLMVERIGMPLEKIQPTPEISFNQHGSVIIYPEQFVSDPDGEELVFMSAKWVDSNVTQLEITNSVYEILINHTQEQEWDGTVEMNLTIAAGQDIANLTINVTLIPVNDLVIQTDLVPQQQSEEDGLNIIVDFTNYIIDPEGEELVVEVLREYDGLRINSSNPRAVLIDPQTHWNGAEIIEFDVSDGESESIIVTVPINIAPVNDIVEFSKSSLEVEFEEDGVLVLNLDNYTINVDDDVLVYNIEGQQDIVDYSITGSELVLIGLPNLHGETSLIANVSDGDNYSTIQIEVTVKSVPDLPFVQISSLSDDRGTVSILWTISDNDGASGLVYSVTLAGEAIEAGTECVGVTLMTCATYGQVSNAGTYTVEVKVWDNVAQVWSNNVTQDIVVQQEIKTQEVTESNGISDWILPIGLGLVAILLIAYLIQSRR